MSNYAAKLRKERREELTLRALSFATKTEAGVSFPASDYAYVPDPDMPSTWKLRLTATPGGDPDPRIVGAAVAALGEGFRGNKVEIPAADLPAVKARVKVAWKQANPDKSDEDIPAIIACGYMMHDDRLTSFNLQNLDNALEHVEDALDALDDDDVREALSDANAAKKSLEKAADNYSGENKRDSSSPPQRDSSSPYSAETVTFNMANIRSALSHVSVAVAALVAGNVSKASSELNDAEEFIENAIEKYNDKDYDDVVVRRFTRPFPDSAPAPDPGMSGETVNLEGETVEFASCSAARRRITKARRSLRKAIRAYAKCTTSNRVVVYESPPPDPAPAPMP